MADAFGDVDDSPHSTLRASSQSASLCYRRRSVCDVIALGSDDESKWLEDCLDPSCGRLEYHLISPLRKPMVDDSSSTIISESAAAAAAVRRQVL